MPHIITINEISQVTHDVRCFRMSKPGGYKFIPGQATDVSINQPEWVNEKRPFTFTCLDDKPYLEFTIKRYPDHNGVTDRLHMLNPGDELVIDDAWGAIEYKGPGYFIAGGAGITPFIAILRALHMENKLSGNSLFFSNKTAGDIIYEQELKNMLGEQAHFILTKEDHPVYRKAYIDAGFIGKHIKDFSQHFYVCGPDKMVQDISAILENLGAKADTIVFEK